MRPKISQKDVVNYFDGLIDIKFPTDFVIPPDWQTADSISRKLFQ